MFPALDSDRDDAKTDMSSVSSNPGDHENGHLVLAVWEIMWAVHFLRAAVKTLVPTAATLVCVGVYIFTRAGETKQYGDELEDSAIRVIEEFQRSEVRKLEAAKQPFGANHSVCTANKQDISFPFVSIGCRW